MMNTVVKYPSHRWLYCCFVFVEHVFPSWCPCCVRTLPYIRAGMLLLFTEVFLEIKGPLTVTTEDLKEKYRIGVFS